MLTPRQKKIAKLQSSADLLLFKEIEAVEKKIPDLQEVVSSVRGKQGVVGKTGADGKNPMHVGSTPPINPNKGDLWYQD